MEVSRKVRKPWRGDTVDRDSAREKGKKGGGRRERQDVVACGRRCGVP